MIKVFQEIGVLVIILCCIDFSVSRKDKDRKHCTRIVWELQNATLVHNTTGVLKRGNGNEQDINTTGVMYGLVNISKSEEICCVGFKENKKGNCKKCKKGWYGVNCSLKCVCERHQKCDHKVGCLGRIRKSHLSAKDKEQHISTYSTTALINHSLTKNKVTEDPEKMTTFGWKDTTLVRGKEVSIEDSIVTGKESQNENIHDVYIIIVVALCIIVSVLIVTICGRESFRYFNLFQRRKRRNLGDISVRRNTEENLYSDVHHNSNAYITMTDGIPVNTVAQTTQITSATENRASISPYLL